MTRKPAVALEVPANRGLSLPISLPVVILALLITSFVVLRIWHITTYSLWGGEDFSMLGARLSWSDMFTYIIDDIVHPPLFYILLKVWILIGGESLLWLKLLPVLSGIALIVPFLLLCRELNLQLPVINLAVFLVAINGYLIHYAQELRMYSLFAFLALCSFWLFIRFFKSTENHIRLLAVLTLINLLAIYTHYYGWLVVGLEFLFLLLWRRKIIPFGMSMVILIVTFSPWAYLVIQEARSIGGLERNLDWIPKPRLIDILHFYATLNGPFDSRLINLFGLMLFGIPLLPWSMKFFRYRQQKSISDEMLSFSWLMLLAILPVIMIFLVSQKIEQAVWIDRYFIFIAAPYMLLVAAAVYRLEPVWVRNLYIFLIVLWSVWGCINDLRTNRMAWTGAQLGSRVDWENLALQMSQAESASASEDPVKVYMLPIYSRGVTTGFWTISTSLDYYMDLHHITGFEMVSARNNSELIDMINEDHFWVAYFDIVDWTERTPDVVLERDGYRIGEEIKYEILGNRFVLLPAWKK
jgi:hypothetical protein